MACSGDRVANLVDEESDFPLKAEIDELVRIKKNPLDLAVAITGVPASFRARIEFGAPNIRSIPLMEVRALDINEQPI